MTLKQFLRFLLIIVNDARVRSAVEDLGTRVRCKIVNALVNLLVEAENPLEIQSRNSVALLVLGDLLAIVTVLHI